MRVKTYRSFLAAVIGAMLVLGLAAVSAEAHHSFAMYDTSIERTMTGKLVRFVIGANHSQFVLQVVNPDGRRDSLFNGMLRRHPHRNLPIGALPSKLS